MNHGNSGLQHKTIISSEPNKVSVSYKLSGEGIGAGLNPPLRNIAKPTSKHLN